MSKNKILIIYVFLTIGTFTAFWQVNYCDFIGFDDVPYLIENNHIKSGLTMDSLKWAFTTYHAANWHPLTWVSLMVDVQLFGLNPHWHHTTNLLFHIANTLLLFFVLHRMTKVLWQSAFVAALFALHPLHVESVAWVAERKDVLSTLFWMLTMVAYCYYAERPGLNRYLPMFIFFILGLIAKPMLVTLPFVLLLLDYWPLQRFGQCKSYQEIQAKSNNPMSPYKRRGKSVKNTVIKKEDVKVERSGNSQFRWLIIRPLLREKIPLFALIVLSSIITYIAQKEGGAVQSVDALPLSIRIENAIVSYAIYIGKMFWPDNLAVFYPYPRWTSWEVWGAVLFVFAVTLIAVWGTRRFQYLAVGWFWYVGTLVPVIGLVQVGLQSRADRYTYIPMIGLFMMVAWGIPDLLKNWHYRRETLVTLSVISLVGCFAVTWTQVGYWRDAFALTDHAIKVTSNNYIAYNSRGGKYYRLGNYQLAMSDFDRAIEICPGFADAYTNRGNVYHSIGNFIEAIKNYDKAIALKSKFAEAYYNRGNSYSNLGKKIQAIEDYNRAIELRPEYIDAYYNRGNAYFNLGNYTQAIVDYDNAIKINPKNASAYFNRAVAYNSLGNKKQTYEDLGVAALLGDEKAKYLLRNQGISR